MNLQVLGCSHRTASVEVRERLAFGPDQTRSALTSLRREFPRLEAVLLSTCNRVEVYTAGESGIATASDIARFLARFHGMEPVEIMEHLYERSDRDAIRHLFLVSSSLDSMVIGEPQILAQVKQAYQLATEQRAAGPLTHAVFQWAVRVARRVATETSIHQRRTSIPAVAVADFAQQIFERFDDKRTLVIGAGEMAEETLKYLRDQGARRVTVINRSPERAADLATRWDGQTAPWSALLEALSVADLVISTTGASRPIVTREQFRQVEQARRQRSLFILDLAVPRDFDPAIGSCAGVYLYAIDDLRAACQRNRQQREQELPAALKIVDQETDRFLAELNQRAAGPVIQRLRERWEVPKDAELKRLLQKLPALDPHAREEIRRSFDRLVNKLLHPPLESLRQEARVGLPAKLITAVTRLFQLQD